MITGYTAAFQMWDYLYTTILAEAVVGGKLATVVDVRKSAQLARGTGPCVAVQLTGWPNVTPSSNVDQTVDVEFKILIGVPSAQSADGTRAANLDDAMAGMRACVDDGVGKGIVPILNTASMFTVGGTALKSRMGSANFDWDMRGGSDATIWAYYLQTFIATTIVKRY